MTLQLLSQLAIVHYMNRTFTPYGVRTISELPLPRTIKEDLNIEMDLQTMLHFELVIEPTIDYTLPNEG